MGRLSTMILTGSEIKKEVKARRISISPFLEENINPNSYNYRLGRELLEIESDLIDPRQPVKYKKIYLTSKGYVLKPKKLYLGHTLEEIGSDTYMTILIGRSSLGRLGVYLQITADMGHVGTRHCWTLELCVVQPVKIYPYMKIGQVSFWQTYGGNRALYEGDYKAFSSPRISNIYKEF